MFSIKSFSLSLFFIQTFFSLISFSFSSLFHRFLSSLSFFFLSHWFFLFLPLSNPLALALSYSSLTLSLVSHGCELQCFGGHCGSPGHGGSGSWITVWWWIGFGGGWNFVMAWFCVCDGGCFCDLVAGFLFCDWWFSDL